jgi:hypothetical protein
VSREGTRQGWRVEGRSSVKGSSSKQSAVCRGQARGLGSWVKIEEDSTGEKRRAQRSQRNTRSFARASRCRGYITRVLTRVMTPIHQDASAMTEC